MLGTIALASSKDGKKVIVADSRTNKEHSTSIINLLDVICEDYDNEERNLKYLKVCWDLTAFFTPIADLLQESQRAELMKTSRVEFESPTHEKVKLFYIPDKILGITVKWRTHDRGNFYNEHTVDETVYQIKDFFMNTVEPPKTVYEVADLSAKLMNTLNNMGLMPSKLTSPASVLDECLLSKLMFVNIFAMPQEGLDLADACMPSMIEEWREIYIKGNMNDCSDYDLTAAYPSIIANLPSLYKAEYKNADKELDGYNWGMVEGESEIVKDYTPFGLGKYRRRLTTEQVQFIREYGIGDIKVDKAWYIKITKHDKPFDYTMKRLFDMRGGENLRDKLAKRLSNVTYGLLSQSNKGGKYGDYFQPIYAKMITSRASLKVCKFIYDNQVQDNLIAVMVDGVLLDKYIPVTKIRRFGEWRYNGSYPALVMADGYIWYGDKKPLGITYEQAIEPSMLRKLHIDVKMSESTRKFNLPTNYQDWLNKVYRSEHG